MKYVLDASVALKWVLDEPGSPKAKRLRSDYCRQIHELIAPDIFPVEVAHALAKAERRGVILPFKASRLLTIVLSTPPQLHDYLPLLSKALTLASQARIGVHDCLYVVLAEQEGCELITADERLARGLPSHPIVLLASLS